MRNWFGLSPLYFAAALAGTCVMGGALAVTVSYQPDIIQPESMYEKVAPRGDKVVRALIGLMLTPQTFTPVVFRPARPDQLIKRARFFSGADLWPPSALR